MPYNRAMFAMGRHKVIRVFLYFLLFLVSFLVFDSVTVVATVLFAVGVLDHFLSRSDQKKDH